MMEKKDKITKSNKTVKKNTSEKSGKTTKKTATKKANETKKTTTKKVNNAKSTSTKNGKQIKEPNVKNSVKEVVKEENKKVEKVEVIETKAIPKKETKISNDSDFGGDEIRKLLIIIGAVCAVMLAFYFITEVVLKNKDTDTEPDTEIKIEPEIQYEQILMGSLFIQNDTTYYVFAYDEEDPMLDIYNQYLETYKNSDNEPLNVYKVNLSEDFNKSYVDDESYLEGSDITKIKVTGTTLIRIKNDEVYKYYEGYEEISEKLKSMTE